MLHPARGWQHLPHALGAIPSNHCGVFWGNDLPLSQPASCAFSSAVGKCVKQRWALWETQPTNEISNAASRVRDQTPAGTDASSAGAPGLCSQLHLGFINTFAHSAHTAAKGISSCIICIQMQQSEKMWTWKRRKCWVVGVWKLTTFDGFFMFLHRSLPLAPVHLKPGEWIQTVPARVGYLCQWY